MKLSRFVLVFPDVRPDEHVLYDVITDQYVGLDSLTLDAVRRWETGVPATPAEADAQQALLDDGYVIADDAADEARLAAFLERAAEGMPGTLYVTLMPTLACNLACTYCFQKDHPAFTKMRSETEEATFDWVLRRVDQSGCRRLLVHFFGGEPLTRKDFLLRAAERFRDGMSQRDGSFEWEMTSNGIGLTAEFARQLCGFGPGTIKLTLDGDRETHDAARVFRNGKGSFDEVYANLSAIAHQCPELKVRVGGNFRPQQSASYERLLDRLEASGLAGKLHEVRFKPVIETDADESGTCTSCASGDLDEMSVQLLDSVQRRGLSRVRDRVTPSGPCELHWKNSFIIDPEGRLYKCPAVAGRPELAVGTVRADEVRTAPLVAAKPWEQCGACPYLPVCMGGCLGGKFLQTGRTDQVYCRKTYFDLAFRKEVRERYLDEFPEAFNRDAS